ncbi:MAG: AsmA family protein, partial [Caulobacteraceae bacterium]|nr:AsmA family protein [Caulobacter sp.]
MRESLTIFAIALIALLSALLVGPYLVDWNGQRDWLAAKLSEAVGAKVRIAGTIDVKLLPRPLFRATDVSIAGTAPQDPSLSAAGLDAELSINSLLQGAVEFVDATALRPRLTVTTRDDGTLVGGAWDVSNPQRFTFRHIRIRDGAVVVRDPGGRQRGAVSGLDAEGEAETLFGPLRLTGQGMEGGGQFRFRLATGAYAGHRLRLKLVADDLKPFGHADLDGTLALAPGADRTGAALSFAGAFTGTGSLRVADGFAPVPWQLTAGGLKADGKGASTAALELRAGADARALVADGAALVDFGAAPSAAVQLKARQLDLDRIAVAPEVAPDTPRPRAAQWIAALQDLAGQGGGPPGRLTLDWAVDAVTSGDLTLTDAKGALELAPGAPVRGRFGINGPDGFRLALDGALERGAGAVYKGRIEAATRNLPATAAWLAPLQPAAADWLANHPGAQDVALAGTFDLSATGAAARDLTLTVDGATVTGAAALTRGVGAEPPRLFADLRADTLDTGRLPALADLAGLGDGVDMSVGVAARTVRLVRVGLSDVTAGPLSAHLTKTGEAVTLDGFSLGGLDGASVSASGTLGADRRLAAQGKIAAPDAAPLAALLRQMVPGAAADRLVAQAALLSPLGLDWSLAGTLDRDGHLSPTLATAKGHAAATAVSATITPEPARLFAAPAVTLLAVLDAPEGGALMRQLGLGAPDSGRLKALGPSHVELTARGTPESGYDTHLAATVADAALGFDGHADESEGTGRGKASGRDARTLMNVLGLPQQPGNPPQPWDLAAAVGWKGAALHADGLAGHVAGTAVTGALARAADTGAVTGTLVLDALPLPGLAALLLGPPAAQPPAPGRSFSAAPFAPAPAALPTAT